MLGLQGFCVDWPGFASGKMGRERLGVGKGRRQRKKVWQARTCNHVYGVPVPGHVCTAMLDSARTYKQQHREASNEMSVARIWPKQKGCWLRYQGGSWKLSFIATSHLGECSALTLLSGVLRIG